MFLYKQAKKKIHLTLRTYILLLSNIFTVIFNNLQFMDCTIYKFSLILLERYNS